MPEPPLPLSVEEHAEAAAPVPGVTRQTPLEDLPELLRVEEAARWLGIGRGLAYELARRGDLPSVRLGRLLRIRRDGLVGQEGR
ncbi:MAG: helix-turn-helix domain-containing protein [Acidimicrobiia bacterium]|nr:helix-turn-helix domain-containing protein [Acidimicrobiia bacterium]